MYASQDISKRYKSCYRMMFGRSWSTKEYDKKNLVFLAIGCFIETSVYSIIIFCAKEVLKT